MNSIFTLITILIGTQALASNYKCSNNDLGAIASLKFDFQDLNLAGTTHQCLNRAPSELILSHEIFDNSLLPFIDHVGPATDPFATTLAMNIQYSPIVSLREQIQSKLNLIDPLKFFTGFATEGEAHVTTVTPVEYHEKLRNFVSPERMHEIAIEYDIQSSDLEILALGSGSAILNGEIEETYFVIVKSDNLMRIRRAIYAEYIKNGGTQDGWNPEHFFPHITIGYTARDLHESDGVLKDLQHSKDDRFKLVVAE